MSHPSLGAPGRRRSFAVLAAAGLLASGVATVSTATAGIAPVSVTPESVPPSVTKTKPNAAFADGTYTVLLRGAPAATYTGGVAGYARTAPMAGGQYRSDTAAAREYTARLERAQQALANQVGARPFYHYTTVVNGFAARLTAGQATALAKQPNVLGVVPDRMLQLDTADSPDFLGLTGRLGVWQRLGGTDGKRGAGSGVIVGIVDTGINSDHPSFARIPGDEVPQDWYGVCETGAGEDAGSFSCNNKLIGGRYFVDGFGADQIADYEPLSPEDVDGHGSHTGSTAAGNYGPEAVIDGVNYGTISGMAPAAKVAAYKVCWDSNDPNSEGGCAGTDSTAAIDAAVADGVNVINFSISGTLEDFLDPVELAFLNAADAGVFVAASAGNSGPFRRTVAHPSPWITTVAASTHTINEATVELRNGERFVGASVTQEGLPFTDTVLARDSAQADANQDEAQLCFPDTLSRAEVAGTIVVCDRGIIARVDKSREVQRAGGVGMILINPTPNSLNADAHFVPTVHLPDTAYEDVYNYVEQAPDPESRILADENAGSTTQVPEVAEFSSRGPSFAAGGDLLKPDISAPGVDVVAAVAPEGNFGRNYDFYSGTSMSSPHIAGLSALIMEAHPRWSPMMIKSAMMTTAYDHATTKGPFAQGAGFVKPREFLDPGLTYDSDYDDWVDFLAGQGVVFGNGEPVSDTKLRASNLNLASIAIGDLAGKERVRRTVRNVGGERATYKASVEGLEGIDVKVVPDTLTLKRQQRADYRVVFTREDAPFRQYAKGHLTWSDGQHEVRIPVVVKPLAIAAPEEIISEGNQDFATTVRAGFAGTLVTAVRGLVAGKVTEASAKNDAGGAFDPNDPNNHRQPFVVGEKSTLTRIQIEPDDFNDDLDLYLTTEDEAGETVIVAASATGAAAEQLTFRRLPAGEYTIHVQAWAVNGNEDTTTFEVETFKVKKVDKGNLEVTPKRTDVSVGERVRITGEVSGLDKDTPYLGYITYREAGEGPVGRTIVSVND